MNIVVKYLFEKLSLKSDNWYNIKTCSSIKTKIFA